MNLSMKWLNDYVKADMNIKEFADKMTMSGSKVEKYTDLSLPLKNIVVGKVISIERHTDSEKLWVAQIETGLNESKIVQIVTGAQNVYAGAYIPVVLDGGIVIDRHNKSVIKIKKGKLRGVESNGMMLSFDELGMEKTDFPYASADGILIFNDDPEFANIKIGMDATEFVGLKDTAVEFEITNNRPDCLSVLGLARETAATFNLPFNPPVPKFKGVKGDIDLKVRVDNKKLCSRYMAGVVKNVKIEPSPRWMAERLRACGIRAINNFVDITNYVMLEYGHPMHAFDKRYIEGNQIIVRNAENGEKITLLDGSEQVLNEDTLVIADGKKPIAVAGVMGGEYSGIMADTETVVFEAACFDNVSVRLTSKRIGHRTESSSRFEKDIDPFNAKDALYRALELVEILKCGDVVDEIIDIDNIKKTPVSLKHNPEKINKILGSDISAKNQLDILKRLGYTETVKDGEIYVSPPLIRTDIERDCDLAEDVARIYGYDEIKSTIPLLGTQGMVSAEEVFENKIVSIMLGQGLFECLSFSFISPKAYEKAGFDADDKNIVIRNPLGEDTSVMRTSVLPSMLEILSRNCNNRIPNARFFEIAKTYRQNPSGDLPDEHKVLCVGLYGANEDFFALKGIIEELIDKCGIDLNEVKFTALRSNKTFHSGRCAEITVSGLVIGVLGEINPVVSERFGISVRAYAAEIRMDRLLAAAEKSTPKFKALPKFPSMVRDLSLVCGEDTSSGEIIEIIKNNGRFLEQISFFDMYKGGQIEKSKKSLSYKLVLRKNDGTLTDEEADKIITKILNALEAKDIVLRKI